LATFFFSRTTFVDQYFEFLVFFSSTNARQKIVGVLRLAISSSTQLYHPREHQHISILRFILRGNSFFCRQIIKIQDENIVRISYSSCSCWGVGDGRRTCFPFFGYRHRRHPDDENFGVWRSNILSPDW